MTVELAIIGGGNMGAALLGGLVDARRLAVERIVVVEVRAERRAELAEQFPGLVVRGDLDGADDCVAAVLAVKPGDVAEAAASAVAAGAQRVLSIAAGVRLATIEAAAGPGIAVIRAMPNTPALVRLGACAIAAGSAAGPADVEWAEAILGAVGTVDVIDEDLLDAFTGVAGSGPAYVFVVAEALVAAAIAQGLEPEMAMRVVRQLLLGSATLLDREGDPTRLREMVTSPNGTTAAGLARLDAHGVAAAFDDAVRAATERSRELG
jgi:pyrroline-5-carboxylate reductase